KARREAVVEDRQLGRSLGDLSAVLVGTVVRRGPVLVLWPVRRLVLMAVLAGMRHGVGGGDGVAFVVNCPVAQYPHHRLRIGEGDGEQHEYGGQAFEHELGFRSSSEIPVSASYPVLQASFRGRHGSRRPLQHQLFRSSTISKAPPKSALSRCSTFSPVPARRG